MDFEIEQNLNFQLVNLFAMIEFTSEAKEKFKLYIKNCL